jgi:hypothetical protein
MFPSAQKSAKPNQTAMIPVGVPSVLVSQSSWITADGNHPAPGKQLVD